MQAQRFLIWTKPYLPCLAHFWSQYIGRERGIFFRAALITVQCEAWQGQIRGQLSDGQIRGQLSVGYHFIWTLMIQKGFCPEMAC